MIAVIQFDAASMASMERLLAQGALPAFADLRRRGTWFDLETPARDFEGAAAYTLYTGVHLGDHGLYYPWQWCASEQRVRFFDDLPAPEAVWERLGRDNRRCLVIDPYEMRPPQTMDGFYLSGWQFKNRVVLRSRSMPKSLHRQLVRELGRPPVGEEVYGKSELRQLLRLKHSLVAAPRRGAELIETLLKREEFDFLWISLSAAHLGGHKFLDMTRIQEQIGSINDVALRSPLDDIYREVDLAIGRIVSALPAGSDVLIVSPSGMSPNTSRSHLLPAMLDAVVSDQSATGKSPTSPTGSSLWQIRALLPTGLRAAIAEMMPDRWAMEIAARLELRNVNWADTGAFMMPNDDKGYIRLNLQGRERDGILAADEAGHWIERISDGLMTFRNADGAPAVRAVECVADLPYRGPFASWLPDLIVHWTDRVVDPLAGVTSKAFGGVSSPGWGTGRTGCHNGDAWAIVVPGSSRLVQPGRTPHIVDVAATACSVLGVDHAELPGQPLLESTA